MAIATLVFDTADGIELRPVAVVEPAPVQSFAVHVTPDGIPYRVWYSASRGGVVCTPEACTDCEHGHGEHDAHGTCLVAGCTCFGWKSC